MLSFSKMSYKTQKKVLIVLFLFIPMVLLAVFSYYPLIKLFQYSVLKWDGVSLKRPFVGLDNYIEIFKDPKYFKLFIVSIYYFIGALIQLAIALYFATILNFKIKGKNFFKGVLFFPNLLNGVAIGFAFLYFFTPNGVLDTIMNHIGLGHFIVKWLGDERYVNYSLAGTSVWRYMGGNLVLFIGAIQSIDGEIYEAADLDGANKWQQFKYIIFPSIKQIVELNAILAIRGSLAAFEVPYIMTGGAMGSSTFVIQTITEAFSYQKLGFASAMAVVLLFITVVITGIQQFIFRDKEA